MEPDVEWLEVQEGVLEKQKQSFIVNLLHSSSKLPCCINQNPQMSVAHLCSFRNELASSSHINCQSKIVRYISYFYPRKIIIRKIILGIITESKLIDHITKITYVIKQEWIIIVSWIKSWNILVGAEPLSFFLLHLWNLMIRRRREGGRELGRSSTSWEKGGGGAFPGPHSLDPPPMVTGHQVWTAP